MKIDKYLQASAVANVLMVAQKLDRRLTEEMEEFGLTFMQGLILVSIFFENGRMAQPTVMAKTFEMSKSNLSHLLNRFQEAKLITRRNVDEDQRRQSIQLTAQGERMCLKLIKYFDSLQSTLESSFKGEKRAIEFNKKVRQIGDALT